CLRHPTVLPRSLPPCPTRRSSDLHDRLDPRILLGCWSGSYSEEVTPVPISNTAVKLFSADGSRDFVSARVGRRQAFIAVYLHYVNRLLFFCVLIEACKCYLSFFHKASLTH